MEQHADGMVSTAYWIAFGPHGPRAEAPAGEGTKVFLYTILGVVAAGVLFGATRAFAKPPPATMTKEWQEASNERALEKKMNPISGRACFITAVYRTLTTLVASRYRLRGLRRKGVRDDQVNLWLSRSSPPPGTHQVEATQTYEHFVAKSRV